MRSGASAAVVIFFASILTACAGVAVLLCADLFWTDLLHVNPGRTAPEMWETMLAFPIFGLVLGALWFALPVALGAVLSGLVIAWRGRLFPAAFGGIAMLATAAFAAGWIFAAPAIDDETGETLDGQPWWMLVGASALLVASLFVGWWFYRRRLTVHGARPVA